MLEYKAIEPNKRVIEVGKSTYEIWLDRAVGFWKIKPYDGPLPKALDSVFTKPDAAALALNNYLANRRAPRNKAVEA